MSFYFSKCAISGYVITVVLADQLAEPVIVLFRVVVGILLHFGDEAAVVTGVCQGFAAVGHRSHAIGLGRCEPVARLVGDRGRIQFRRAVLEAAAGQLVQAQVVIGQVDRR